MQTDVASLEKNDELECSKARTAAAMLGAGCGRPSSAPGASPQPALGCCEQGGLCLTFFFFDLVHIREPST